jgi:hypothetical protein
MGLLDDPLGKLREVAEEIRDVTGASPEGTPRTNGAQGSEVDLGRLLIWKAKLSNGDKFLVTLGACFDEAAAKLGMDRMAEVEKPLEGVGERGLVRVKSYGPLTELLRRSLDRL